MRSTGRALAVSWEERLTCLDHMVHGGEALADGGADGAQDEERRQVNVAHQRPAQQAAVFVSPVNAAGRGNVLKGTLATLRNQ